MLIAHAGHTLTTIAYFVPVVAFLVWLTVSQIRERRGRLRDRGTDGGDPTDRYPRLSPRGRSSDG